MMDCCLRWEEAFRRTVSHVAAFASLAAVRRLEARAAGVFWGADAPARTARTRAAGVEACFLEWFLHDYVAPTRTGPLLGEFADTADGLYPREEQLLFALLRTPLRPFEIAETPGPRGVPVKDLLGGAEGVVSPQGLPEGLIRSDVCIGRLVPVGRLWRPGIGLLQIPPGGGGELLAYLRAAYRFSRPGRHVSLEDYADGAAHLYQQFFLDRGREMGGKAHRTCRWLPFSLGRRRYVGADATRIRAVLDRQSALERMEAAESETRYAWVDPLSGAILGTVGIRGDELLAQAETDEDLGRLAEFLETCVRGLMRRGDPDRMAVPPESPTRDAFPVSGPAGQLFIRRVLERWPGLPHPLLSDATPSEACRSQSGREQVGQLLVEIERDMARQKRLGRAWADVGPLWGRLDVPPPLPRGVADVGRGTATGREGTSRAKG
jgi:hypothetical protein